MRTAVVALITMIALLANVFAGPRKVLVLPLDGDAPAAQKEQLDVAIETLARTKLDGDITIGDTTFSEAATAVGCDPQDPACPEMVRTTLGVDELVYGSADTADGTTTVTVRRAAANLPPVERTATVAETETGDAAAASLAPAFGDAPDPAAVPVVPERPRPATNFFDTRERKLGFGLAASGAISIVIGLSLWASKSDLQDRIDSAPTDTSDDLDELRALEDRAASRALWGNIMVVLGVGLGGAGAYFLYKDHQQRTATVTPVPVEAGTGMTFVLTGRW